MTREPVLIYGSGPHSRVIIDILENSGRYHIIGVLDDDLARLGEVIMGFSIVGGISWLKDERSNANLLVAIGNNATRRRVAECLKDLGYNPATAAVHPSAQIGREVLIGDGTVIMAGAVVNPGANLGLHCIVNTGATVDHTCEIASYAHIGPGAHIAGGSRVGAGALISVGACVKPGMTIGEGAIVGAGAAVVEDVPPATTVVGVPARPIRKS